MFVLATLANTYFRLDSQPNNRSNLVALYCANMLGMVAQHVEQRCTTCWVRLPNMFAQSEFTFALGSSLSLTLSIFDRSHLGFSPINLENHLAHPIFAS